METFHLVAVFVILAATFACFVKEWLSPDIAALSAFALCIALGMLSVRDVEGVFRNGAPLTIAAMFVISSALTRTGVIDQLAHLFQRVAGQSELRALVLLVIIVMPLSGLMNNTPVVVVFLPILFSFARATNLRASRLLMPLSFFAIMGGTLTLFGTSTNILVAGIAQDAGLERFGVFEITKLGLVFGLVGAVYMLTVGRRLLPDRDTVSSVLSASDTRDFLSTAEVEPNSPFVGKLLSETEVWRNKGFRIFYVVRDGQRVGDVPLDQLSLEAGDTIVLKASTRGVSEIAAADGLAFDRMEGDEVRGRVKLVEAMIGPQCPYVGKSLAELDLRNRHGIVVAALHRKGANLVEKLSTVRLHLGDTLLIEAPEENLKRFEARDEGLVFLNEEVERAFLRKKAPLAVAILLVVVALAASGVPMLSAAFVGAVAAVVFGCVEPRDAYRSIEWPILFIIFGMLGLGQAMDNTGAARLLAEGAAGLLKPLGPLAVLAVIYLLSSILTEIVTNNAVAILLTPIAITIAVGMEVDPRPFVVAIMFGASASFATPIGYQTNTYVFGAGGYKFSDFAKVGLPLNLIFWVVAVLLIPVFWPF